MSSSKKKVSRRQLQIYVDFYEKHSLLRTGKLTPGMPQNAVNILWQEITETLNNCGDGAIREIERWKTTFIEWKSQVRKRAREGKEMTEVEKRFLAASGVVAVEGMKNVPEIGILRDLEQLPPTEYEYSLDVEDVDMENVPIIINTEIVGDISETLLNEEAAAKETLGDVKNAVAKEKPADLAETVLSQKREKVGMRKRRNKNPSLLEQYVIGQQVQKEGLRAIASGLSEIALSINNLTEVLRNKDN